MKNSYVKRMVRTVIMLISLVSAPVMVVLLMMPRTYGSYMEHVYEVNYWWQTLVLTVAISCIICRTLRRSRYINTIIKITALISVMIVIVIAITQSWWGIIRLCDRSAGLEDGVFVFLMSPIFVFSLWCAYDTVGEFVSSK